MSSVKWEVVWGVTSVAGRGSDICDWVGARSPQRASVWGRGGRG